MRLQPFGRVYIAGTGRSVRVVELLDRPQVCALAADGIAWEFERRDWWTRRPHRMHMRAWRAWKQEGRALDLERERIERGAADLGL